jgi:hypothetical protein
LGRTPKPDFPKNCASVCVDLIDDIVFVDDKNNVVATDEAWDDERLGVDLILNRHRMRNSQSANSRGGQDCFLLLPAGSKIVIMPR